MCHAEHDRPPAAPTSTPVSRSGLMTLAASDGVESDAFFAHPDGGSTIGVVILPDFRGLTDFYEELAVRFASVGVHAVSIDYFVRELGRDRTTRPPADDLQFYGRALNATDKPGLDRDVAAAVAYLRSPDGGGATSIFTVGFCGGGTFAWHQSANGLGAQGHISFYGATQMLDHTRIPEMREPILMLISGKDAAVPVDAVLAAADEMRRAGVNVETHVYANTTHNFFMMGDEFADECADAWTRVLAYVGVHSGTAPSGGQSEPFS